MTSLQQRLIEAFGLLLMGLCGYLVVALLSHHPLDPSWDSAAPVNSIHNWAGVAGAWLAGFLYDIFGLSALIFTGLIGLLGWTLLKESTLNHAALRFIGTPLLLCASGMLLRLFPPLSAWPLYDAGIGNGGLLGTLLVNMLYSSVGLFGVIMASLIGLLLSLMWLAGATLEDFVYGSKQLAHRLWALAKLIARSVRRFMKKRSAQFDLPLATPAPKRTPKRKPTIEAPTPKKQTAPTKQADLPLSLDNQFCLPSLDLLDENKNRSEGPDENALTQNGQRLEAELANFNVKGAVTHIRPGPVITTYELEPAPGTKSSTVIGLSDDLARALSAQSVRVTTMPGRSVLGVEMPNTDRGMVSLRELLETQEFETHPGKLTVALGVDTTGQPVYADISKMPHALIAGTTGSGKSVAMNAFILSLLYRLNPQQLKFIMIDPKMLELSIYNDIPHLLTPVITDPNKAAGALKWAVKEMEHRYKLMSQLGVKNLQSFNAKFAELQAKGETPTRQVQVGFDASSGQPKYEEQPLADGPLPHIVVVIDELADLMMVAGKEVEMYIARLAQMARAAGMHLLVATQRPSVDVVTGLIKANIPTRISFNVTSRIDSRTVLDQQGAEHLLGKGDMLYMGNGSNNLERLHGAFVSEEECLEVARHLKEQGTANYKEEITKGGSGADGGTVTAGADLGDDDPLYRQAIELIAREQKASTSFVQRHLKIGYNRAADIIDKLEADGLISEANHVGKRDVIVKEPPEGGY